MAHARTLALALALALALPGCAPSPSSSTPDAGCDGSCDDAWRAQAGTCQPNGTGGQQCVGGSCPYTCCLDGHVARCTVPAGSECNFVMAIECGGGTCVASGACPTDGGGSDAGP